ncbi:hypothetical protein JQX14_04850 [Sulfitobacter pseudonitzschiae]|uniref:Uncharacterized protein n=2 Tax=Pseudosulfitobacter pseudonitzschiae TaxID=1402135 RepID=A0A9Q2NG54_9RHOB|nr:hypothetical protein [Pseudosulfitobacter pseudonitzschiae]
MNSSFAMGLGIALINIIAVYAIYGTTGAIWGGRQTAETKDLSGSITFRVASLQGWLLPTAFTQLLLGEIGQY